VFIGDFDERLALGHVGEFLELVADFFRRQLPAVSSR
jgi:hypothetical protein